MTHEPPDRPSIWTDYMKRFDTTELRNAQLLAEQDNDLSHVRYAAGLHSRRGPQEWCLDLATLFDVYDTVALRFLTVEQRAEQMKARQAVYQYCDALHDAVKKFDESCDKAETQAVYGLTDLTNALVDNASQASMEAGDPDDE